MTTETSIRLRISRTEVIVIVVGVSLSLALLFPALYASRENARAFYCQENLRRLDEALQTYRGFQGRNPNRYSWPLDLLPTLSRTSKNYLPSGMPMHEPRPTYLTCPSNPASTVTNPFDQISLYVVVQSFDENGHETWTFRDRSIEPVESSTDHWCVGIVLNPVEAEEQLLRPGPHSHRTFQQSDGRAGYSVVAPRS